MSRQHIESIAPHILKHNRNVVTYVAEIHAKPSDDRKLLRDSK